MRYAGISWRLPAGWEVRAHRQEMTVPGRPGNVVVHVMTRPIPADRGDFGSGAYDLLGSDDVFVALLEYDREEAATALFAARGLPTVRPAEFTPGAMQRPLPGLSGAQYFFTEAGRAFCLFVVLAHARRSAGAVRVNQLLSRLSVEPS